MRISPGLHLPELDEDVQSHGEQEEEEREGSELTNVATEMI